MDKTIYSHLSEKPRASFCSWLILFLRGRNVMDKLLGKIIIGLVGILSLVVCSYAESLNENGEIVLKRGYPVTGFVIDEQGHLISDALVIQGTVRRGNVSNPDNPTARTDKDGYFRFDNSIPGEMVLTVEKEGYAPELRVIQVTENLGQIEFVLSPGKTIRGKVITIDGKPVPDTNIWAHAWRGYNTICWISKTDSEGHFQWDSAPSEEVLFDLYSQEYMSISNYPMKVSPEEYVIAVREAPVVKIHVVDDITGNPVTEFDFMIGFKEGCDNKSVSWQKTNVKVSDGYYKHRFKKPKDWDILRVKAGGYLPADVPFVKNSKQTETFEIRLKNEEIFRSTVPTIEGIITTIDGKVLDGAEVGWFQTRALINDIKFERREGIPYTNTDSGGHFVLSAEDKSGLLVVLHEEGWKKILIDETGNLGYISVEPWSVVRGKAWISTEPAVSQRIKFFVQEPYNENIPNLQWDTMTITGKYGEFVLPHVPAGDIMVGIVYSPKRVGQGGIWASRVYLNTKPGETYEVQIGGTGRAVIGRVILSYDFNIKEFSSDINIRVCLRTPGQRFTPPSEIAANPEKVREWSKSPEGQAWLEEERKALYFTIYVEPDGSFRIDDVPPGTYELIIYVHDKLGGSLDNVIIQGTREVIVPPGTMPTDGPIDLGDILLVKR